MMLPRLAAAVAAATSLMTVPACAGPLEGTQAQVRIIDGDTFYVDGVKIRLWGIDAPGKRDRGQPDVVKAYEDEATAELRRLTAGGVRCDATINTSYDREVKVCYSRATGNDLGGTMVLSGYAVDWPRHTKGRCDDAERRARTGNNGFWANPAIVES